ncbi:Insulinase family protein [Candidatus Hepatincolaceae symbiont of Richtersius coronifer]
MRVNYKVERAPQSLELLEKVVVFNTPAIKKGLFYSNDSNEVISINIIFKGGAALDLPNYDGLSNFLANAMLEGAGGLTPYQFKQLIEASSLKISSDASRDNIAIYLSTLQRYKKEAFALLNLVINQPNLGNQEIKLTQNKILASLDFLSTNANYLLSTKLREELYPNHPYYRSIIGEKNTIQSINSKVLKNFKDKVLTKENLYLSVSGNITLEEVKQEMELIFSNLPAGDPEDFKLQEVEPKITNKVVEVPFPAAQSEILLIFNAPKSPDNYIYAQIFNTYLGGLPESVLFSELRNKSGLVYSIASILSKDEITSFWRVSLGTALNSSDEAITKTKNLLVEKKLNYSFDDIKIAKNWMLNNQLKAFATNTSIASYLNHIQFREDSLNNYLLKIKTIQNINNDQIRNMLAKIDLDNILVIKLVSLQDQQINQKPLQSLPTDLPNKIN